MVEEFDKDSQDVEFTVNEWENKPENNLLVKGRYKFKVLDVESKTAQSGNECVVIRLTVEGKRITDWLIRCDSQGKKHQMTFKYHNFLYAIGIRNTNKRFTISKSQMVGKEGLCDVVVNKEGTDNSVQNYSPIEEAIAPIQDVPAENEKPIEKEPSKESPKSESVEDL